VPPFFCAAAGAAASVANAKDRNNALARISPPEILVVMESQRAPGGLRNQYSQLR
jgi:hypothetical protein